MNALIIDDDATDRYVTRRVLSRSQSIGTVAEVEDGAAALTLFTGEGFAEELGPHPPRSLVLLDINMPTMSGFELLEQLEADHVVTTSEVSVIVLLTSSDYSGDRERADQFSLVDGYVQKPLTVEKLHALLERHWSKTSPDIAS